jgi:hypothetical protein
MNVFIELVTAVAGFGVLTMVFLDARSRHLDRLLAHVHIRR